MSHPIAREQIADSGHDVAHVHDAIATDNAGDEIIEESELHGGTIGERGSEVNEADSRPMRARRLARFARQTPRERLPLSVNAPR
jgi:hypothetical protein